MREQVVSALASLLGSVATVFRQLQDIDDIADTAIPCVFVEDDQPEQLDYLTGDYVHVTLPVNLIGYVRSADAVSTAINDLDKQIVQKVASDQTLGGLVAHMTVLPSTERSGSQFAPYGYFVRPVEIKYETTLSGGL